jgi:flavin reductase (DIM6/NTAB) family NADH-FMN oxidoreductase RutF
MPSASNHDPSDATIEAAVLRSLMGHFPTGVTIVASHHDGVDQGMTANSLTSISLEPPLIAISMRHGSRTAGAIASSRGFAITLLAHDQDELAKQFARSEGGHFEGVAVERTQRGHPYLPEGIGFLECTIWQDFDAGDHRVIIGQVTEATLVGGWPLLFFKSKIGSLPQDHHPWADPDHESAA